MALSPTSSRPSGLGNVVVSGTPSSGQEIVASSATAASWQTPSAGSLTLITNTVLGADGTFDMAGISQAYTDLVIMLLVRGTDAGAGGDQLRLRVNNDSTAGAYDTQYLLANSSTVSSAPTLNSGGVIIAQDVPAAAADANYAAYVEVVIPGYASTTWYHRVASSWWSQRSSSTSRLYNGQCVGTYKAVAAITRVQVACVSTANLLAGSSMRLYGLT